MSVPIIGQADGPTSVFFVGRLGGGWVNVFGVCIVVAILIPNIIYAIRFRGEDNKCTNKVMNVLEQVGRYACMALIILNIGKEEFSFAAVVFFLLYLLGNAFLILVYWFIWMLYFVAKSNWKSMALAIIPTIIFLFSGITLMHPPLIIAAIVFGISHIYVTSKNLEPKV